MPALRAKSRLAIHRPLYVGLRGFKCRLSMFYGAGDISKLKKRRRICEEITRTVGASVRVIEMLGQLDARFPVERAIIFFTEKCISLIVVVK